MIASKITVFGILLDWKYKVKLCEATLQPYFFRRRIKWLDMFWEWVGLLIYTAMSTVVLSHHSLLPGLAHTRHHAPHLAYHRGLPITLWFFAFTWVWACQAFIGGVRARCHTKFLLTLILVTFYCLWNECQTHCGHQRDVTWVATHWFFFFPPHTGRVCWTHFLLFRRQSGSCCLKSSRLLFLLFLVLVYHWPSSGLSYKLSATSAGRLSSPLSAEYPYIDSIHGSLKCSPSDICYAYSHRISTKKGFVLWLLCVI